MLTELFRKKLAHDSGALERLELRLDKLGYEDLDPRYAEVFFLFHAIRQYDVQDDFPRIKVSAGPAGVENVKYEVATNAMQSFLIAE